MAVDARAAVTYDRMVPPGTGRGHALRIGYELDRASATAPVASTTDFAATVRQVLDSTGMDPSRLCLEVTESVFLADGPRAVTALRVAYGLQRIARPAP